MTKTNKQIQTQTQTKRVEDTIYEMVLKAGEKDNNIRVQKVTGYVSVKYGNKVLFEFHDKKKAISHLTFAQTQKVFSILKSNDLIQRVVPKSYGWKYDTECLLTDKLVKLFPQIFKSILDEAIEKRNLKVAKEQPKKVANA